MGQVTMPAPDETSGGGSRGRQHAGQHITVPAGWGAQYGRGAHRPSRTAARPDGQDDPLGIYRPSSAVDHRSRPAASPVPGPAAQEPSRPEPGPRRREGTRRRQETGVAKKAADTAREKSRGLGLRGSEILGGACASAVATGVTSGLGVGGTVFGSAMTSIVIAVGGAVFVKLFSRTRHHLDRGRQRGIWARTAGIGLLLTVLTGVIGAVFLSKEVGGSISQQIVDVTSSRYQIQEMWRQAWPYLREAWQAAHR